MNTALVLGAGFYHRRAIRKLKEGGWRVAAVDRDPKAPGAAEADLFAPLDICDVAGVVALAKRLRPACVLPLNEFGMPAHAAAAAALGLPGVRPDQVAAVVDKLAMRRAWAAAGLDQPAFRPVRDLAEARAAAGEIGFPCVVKPADSGGSGRGVMVLGGPAEVAEGYAFARPFARDGVVLLETFLAGTELTVEGLCRRGRHRVLAVSDKEKPPLRTRVALSLNYPAALPEGVLARVTELVGRAVAALGLSDCATHTELIVDAEGRPWLVELGARGGGGHIFSTIVEAVSGVAMPLALAAILSGGEPAWEPAPSRGACYRFFSPPPGTIAAIEGLEEAGSLPGVLDLGMFKRVGERVNPLLNSQERAGFVVTQGRDRQEAHRLADRVEELVRITVH